MAEPFEGNRLYDPPAREEEKAGDFWYGRPFGGDLTIFVILPLASGDLGRVGVSCKDWGWNGDYQAPTLKKPIKVLGGDLYDWHGYLKAGWFKAVE